MEELNEVKHRQRTRAAIVALATTLACGGIVYRLLVMHQPLGRTGLMFIGLPAVLAVLLAVAAPAKSITGSIVFGITLVLLLLAPVMGEGYLCILIAAPLFYAVGVGMGLAFDATRKWREDMRKRTVRCALLVLLAPMSLEGVFPGTTIHRGQTVEVTRVVNASSAAVEGALAESPRIGLALPRFLRIGFPRPLAVHGSGLAVGDARTIHFSGAEGDPEGDLVMRVTEREPGFARFETVSDASKLTQWVRWEASDVQWRAVDATHTRVTWRIEFARELDPAWYFTPWERLAVREAAGYLIRANAMPQVGPQAMQAVSARAAR
ncbi:MAG TPA: SRPBCC family protein [Acidobacteriaceae bacterium]|jgi:hypothetical protein|nr:SRPBCC family protein [Acidobacteriaceae bacterium]